MTELSPATDLDTLEDIERVMKRDEIEQLGILRTDLKALVNYTHSPDLSSALQFINTKTVLEVGPSDRFEALINIHQSLPDLPLENIWAVDPEFNFNVYPDQTTFVQKITKKSYPLQEILEEISGKFDLVLCKGVVSIGAGITTKNPSVLTDILKTIKESINPHNKKAVAIISSKRGLLLPFNTELLRKVGLEPVYFMPPTTEDLHWEKILAEMGMLDRQSFKLVICQRAN